MTLHLQRHITDSFFPAAQLRDDLGHSPVLLSQEAQWEVRVSPDRTLPAGAAPTTRGRSGPSGNKRTNFRAGVEVTEGFFLRSWGFSTGSFPPLQAPSIMIPGNFPVSELGTLFHGVRLVCLSSSILGQTAQKFYFMDYETWTTALSVSDLSLQKTRQGQGWMWLF